MSQFEQDLINLLHNGRASHWVGPDVLRVPPYDRDIYYPILMQLNQLWQEKGDQPRFYEDYYLPLARKLIQPELDQASEHDWPEP